MISPKTTFSLGPDDDIAFQDLFENHLPLVRSIVERLKRKLPNDVETEDLYCFGVTGLVAAARNYRPLPERTFAAYAATKISGAILDELRRTDWMSRANRSKARRLSSAIPKLEQQKGGNIIDGTDEQSEFEDQSMHEIIPDDSSIPALDVLDREEVLSLLAERMAELPDMSKKVLAMYYRENMPLSAIAACFGLTESQICQIHNQAVGLLRNYLVSFLA